MAPSIDAQIDLVPVDYVSQAIVRSLVQGMPEGVHIAHLNNPRPVTVREMIDRMNACGYRIDTAPYPDWRAAMLSRGAVRRETILDALGPLFALQLSEHIGWLAHIPRLRRDDAGGARVRRLPAHRCGNVPLCVEYLQIGCLHRVAHSTDHRWA
ncbi:MAG: hypothetical protein IPK16_27815 [Anaerolineales bacterium]|nr:hypothetical protein [Anaerolineales bacterium]